MIISKYTFTWIFIFHLIITQVKYPVLALLHTYIHTYIIYSVVKLDTSISNGRNHREGKEYYYTLHIFIKC
jgi:hypothetical protein